MAAAAALNVVKQIQVLADGPVTREMRSCLGQVVSSLQFFLDHPDSRVRLNAARTLLKLQKGYGDDVTRLDLGRSKAALERYREAVADGAADADTEEMYDLLMQLFGTDCDAPTAETTAPSRTSSLPVAAAGSGPVRARPVRRSSGGPSSPCEAAAPQASPVAAGYPSAANDGARAANQPQVPPAATEDARGEVVLKVASGIDDVVKGAIRKQVVQIGGVVSLTFEGQHIVVTTRTPKIAADAMFLADVLSVVKAQGLQGVSLLRAEAARETSKIGTPKANSLPAAQAPAAPVDEVRRPSVGSAGSAGSASGDEEDEDSPRLLADDDDDEGEPAYLDDDEDEESDRAANDVRPVGSAAGGFSSGFGSMSAGGGFGGLAGRPAFATGSMSSGGALGANNWSFFSQSNWMTGRRMQEFGDDPTIAARLAKAKQREEVRRQEDSSRLGALTSWLTGGVL